MTPAQLAHYRLLWATARRVLRGQGLSSAQCEARRHEIHVEVLGRSVSSKLLTNRQFDLVKGAFLAISDPANLAAQQRAEEGDVIRARHVVTTLCAQLVYDDDSLQSLIDRMQREGHLREPDRPRGETDAEVWDIELDRERVCRLTFNDLTPSELETVIVALRLQVERAERQRAEEHAAPSFAF